MTLLDSGASCSVISNAHIPLHHIQPEHTIRLLNADGRCLSPIGITSVELTLGDLTAVHSFVVVNSLSTPVILGCDFLTEHGLTIDFKNCTVSIYGSPRQQLNLQLGKAGSRSCNMLTLDDELPQAIPATVTDNTIPTFDMSKDIHPDLAKMMDNNKMLFSQQLGKTSVAKHFIDTGDDTPVKVPPCSISFHYTEKVSSQLQEMAAEGIIRPSNSLWCAPVVYVPKSNGEIRICVDFVQPNHLTKKDSYPVPQAEGLAGKKVLRSAYWQFPMHEDSIEKTAFCPGPRYGHWEFTVMPYGLTGATQTCQRGLDDVFHDCKYCVDNYVDDCIVF